MIKTEQWKKIEGHIVRLMIDHGPDGHADGSGIIADYVMSLLEQARQEAIEDIRNIVVKTAIEGGKDQDEFKGLYLYSRVLSRIDELKKKGKK